MGLRDLELQEQYRSDIDNLVADFFIPCLSNCIQYDRCIEYVSIKSLTTLSLGFENFANNQAKMRIITGHRFRTEDLSVLSKLFAKGNGKMRLGGNFIRDSKIESLRSIVQNHKLEIYIPNVDVDYLYFSDMDTSVKLIRDAGGVAILAHFGTIKNKIDIDMLEKFLKEGRIDGVEVISGFIPDDMNTIELLRVSENTGTPMDATGG